MQAYLQLLISGTSDFVVFRRKLAMNTTRAKFRTGIRASLDSSRICIIYIYIYIGGSLRCEVQSCECRGVHGEAVHGAEPRVTRELL